MRISYKSRNKTTFLIELELKKWGKKKLYNKILGLLRSSCFKNQYFFNLLWIKTSSKLFFGSSWDNVE